MNTLNSSLCLDTKFSTTRIVTREKTTIENNSDDKFETVLFLLEVESRKGEGGLRTQGYFSLFCSKIVGDTGKVIAFEPTDTSFSLLKRNKELNNFICLEIYQEGLGEKNELATFNVGEPGLEVYNSLGPITHQSADPEKFKEVQIHLYEGATWLKNCDINHIDLMKLDVEGGEYAVLKGMLSFFEEQKVSYLLIEITYEMSKAFGYEPSVIISMLKNCGYNWFELKPYGQLKRLLSDQPEKSGMFVAIAQSIK